MFEALDDELTCSETISLVGSDHSSTPGEVVEFTINVEKKACTITACPSGEVQDAYYCGCITEPAVLGKLIDLGISTTERVARFSAPGDFVTIREPSYTAQGRTYERAIASEPYTDLGCVQEISRDDTGYWRQVVFEGIDGNCSSWLNRTSTIVDTDIQTFEFRVFPTVEPPRLGTFFDLDTTPYPTAELTRELSAQKGAFILIRANEAATDNGFAWVYPTLPTLGCMDLVDANYGNMATGYI